MAATVASKYNVFVSYSHEDSGFADRLMQDLRYADISATYDTWILKPGDSFFEKLGSALAEADYIVVVLSPASVKSQWVHAELGLAMATQLKNHDIQVLPALIQDCDLPPSLASKTFADFRKGYYLGLRQLLGAVSPEVYPALALDFKRRERLEAERADLEAVLASKSTDGIRKWFSEHVDVLSALFGRHWLLSEALPNFRLPPHNEYVDLFVINASSNGAEFIAVELGPPDLTNEQKNRLEKRMHDLHRLVTRCEEEGYGFLKTAFLRCQTREQHDQLRALLLHDRVAERGAPPGWGSDGVPEERIIDWVDDALRGEMGRPLLGARDVAWMGKLVCGRRHEHASIHEELRIVSKRLYGQRIEIVSYDRVLDAIDKRAREHRPSGGGGVPSHTQRSMEISAPKDPKPSLLNRLRRLLGLK